MRWFNLGSIERIPLGEGRTFAVAHVTIAVFRTREGAVFATSAECPHKRGPLADGIVAGSTVTCPLHGFRFELATGRALGAAPCAAVKTYPIEVSERGDLLLQLDESVRCA